MYYNTKGGGKRLTHTAENYIRVSRALINQYIEEQRWVKESKNTWFYVDLLFYMPDRRVRDSHNMLKLLLDVMEGIVYKNDYYVCPRIQSVEYDKENPRVECMIQPQSTSSRKSALNIFET